MDHVKLLEEKVRILEFENDKFREEIKDLRRLLIPELDIPIEWELPRRQVQILALLVSLHKPLTKQIYAQVINDEGRYNIDDKVVEAHASKLRKQIKELGLPINITGRRFIGYTMDADSKVYLKQFMRGTDNG